MSITKYILVYADTWIMSVLCYAAVAYSKLVSLIDTLALHNRAHSVLIVKDAKLYQHYRLRGLWRIADVNRNNRIINDSNKAIT